MATTENMTASVDFAEIKKSLAKILDDMAEFAQKYDAVPPPDSFFEARKLLDRKDYNVVVCGEANQGKTSLVNALIGREIFPVKDGIVTSQIFRISHSDKKRFQLVLDDGTNAEISESDLNTYGTESDIVTSSDSILKGRKIKWIEAEVPATFLPEGVHLIDTPGLGSLYGEHSAKTYEWLAKSDAAIFVKSAHRPLSPDEMSCIATIFAVTKNVLFVLSKKDIEDKDDIERRNRGCSSQLTKAFGKTENRQFKFWPVSATKFCNAHGNVDKERISGMPVLKQALANLLERTVGFMAASYADEEACSYWNKTKAFRDERLQGVESSIVAKDKLLDQRDGELVRFRTDWILNEANHKLVLQCIDKEIVLTRKVVKDAISEHGVIKGKMDDRIRTLLNGITAQIGMGLQNFYETIPDETLRLTIDCFSTEGAKCYSNVKRILDEMKCKMEQYGLRQIAFLPITAFDPVSIFDGLDGAGYEQDSYDGSHRKSIREYLKGLPFATSAMRLGGVIGSWIDAAVSPPGTPCGESFKTAGQILAGAGCAAFAARQYIRENSELSQQYLQSAVARYLEFIYDDLTKPKSGVLKPTIDRWLEEVGDMARDRVVGTIGTMENQLKLETERLRKDMAYPEDARRSIDCLENELNAARIGIDKIHTKLVEYVQSIENAF